MTATTITQKEIVLWLFKDLTIEYNSSTIAKKINKTRVGAFKALNELEKDIIVKGRNYGKARFYEINYDDEYALKNVETLLMEEANKCKRWKEEFYELFQYCKIIVLFGSIIRNEHKANDIDLLLIFDKKYNDQINAIIKKKNNLLIKKIHPIKQTLDDIKKNIIEQDKVILDAIRTGVVLYGYEKYIELIKKCHNQKTK